MGALSLLYSLFPFSGMGQQQRLYPMGMSADPISGPRAILVR
uniref:Uncharacterized protein n=1 Tax=Picea glauca TaxID=3330 RepID=A0A117NGV5_PICGL|nr:hypothetical protein ABT39_MTgene5563 [Picea glauca]